MSPISGEDVRAPRELPPQPNVEHLKKEAKDRLRTLRAQSPEAQLAQAQFEVARAYGFSSWRALVADVGRGRANDAHNRLIG